MVRGCFKVLQLTIFPFHLQDEGFEGRGLYFLLRCDEVTEWAAACSGMYVSGRFIAVLVARPGS